MAENRFTVPEGWSVESSGEVATLVGPEGDLRISFVEIEPGANIQETALAAWKKLDPEFTSKVAREVAAPPEGGWEELHQVLYQVASKEARMEIAIVRKLGGRAFVNLVRGTTAGLSRRGAQLGEAVGSWKPEGLRKQNLKDAATAPWSAEHSRQVSEFVNSAMAAMQIPGVAIAVVQGGKVVWAEGFGTRDVDNPAPVTPRTRFMIGSSTKPLTTLLMAKLVEQRKLSWSTPVVDLLPGFALGDAEITAKLELRHTASASTGMPRQDMEFIFRHTGITGEDRMAQMKTMRPTTGFGETFQYSNFLVAAGGFAAARAYSTEGSLEGAYEAAMRELVFQPLGMNDTVLRQAEAIAGEAAMPHATSFEGGTSRIPLEIERSVQSVGPAGGVWSTVLDMAQYLVLELGTHDNGILERRNKGIKIDEHNSYGLGLIVSDDAGLRVIHHGGNTFGFSADMYFLPEKDLGVVVLTNIYVANTFLAALRLRVFELMFGAEPRSEKTVAAGVKMRQDGVELMQKKVTVNPDWSDLVGSYRCEELGSAEISKRDQELWMQFEEWGGPVGGEVEPGGDRLLRLLSPPWRGTLKLLVDGDKLTLDGGQRKYVFQKTAP